jgi:hypothetical protein
LVAAAAFKTSSPARGVENFNAEQSKDFQRMPDLGAKERVLWVPSALYTVLADWQR